MNVTPPLATIYPTASHGKRACLKDLWPFVFLIAAVFIAYHNIYGNSFLYDDLALIVNNQFLRSWHFLPNLFTTFLNAGSNEAGTYYRPLQSLLYLIVFQFFGLSTIAYHLLNVCLHVTNTCLMYILGRKLAFHPTPTFFAALLWALHPIESEAVTYMSSTADTLHALFCLLGTIVLLPNFSARRMALAACFLLPALLCKESTIAFPLMAASMLYNLNAKRFDYRTYLKLWPLVAIVCIYVVVRFVLLTHQPASPTPHTMPAPAESLRPIMALSIYAQLLVWPSHLVMGHDLSFMQPLQILYTVLGFGILLGAAAQITKAQTPISLPLSFGFLWFFVALLPFFGITTPIYEHWMYVPTIGLFLGTSQTFYLLLTKRFGQTVPSLQFMGIASGLAVAALLATLTIQQNKIWHDPVHLYTNMIQQGLPAPNAHTNLANYYAEAGDYKAAIDQYNMAIKESDDTQAEAENNLAMTLLHNADDPAHAEVAREHLFRAVEIDPNYYMALKNLAQFYRARGDDERAALYQDRADVIQRHYQTLSEISTTPP